MRIKLLLSLLLMLMITTSCKTHYDIVMTHVEVPEDYRKQFGETKVLSLSENEITKYTYEDEMISFIWYVSKSQFNFLLKNKTNHSIKIPWDDIVFINPGGRSMRVIHSGIRYIDRNKEQAPSVVAKNSILDDILVPSDYIHYVDDGGSGLGGWKIHDVFHNYEQIGAEASIVFPVIIENVTNEYTFRFQVKDVYKK